MKKSSLFANRSLALESVRSFKMITLVFVALLGLSACDENDESDFTADVEKVIGTYEVSDLFETDEEPEVYEISLVKSDKGAPHIEITNFGDIMYVPVKGIVKGNTFTVPAQTFKGKSMTIVITGSGTFNDNELTFDYVIDTGDSELSHSCEAVKL